MVNGVIAYTLGNARRRYVLKVLIHLCGMGNKEQYQHLSQMSLYAQPPYQDADFHPQPSYILPAPSVGSVCSGPTDPLTKPTSGQRKGGKSRIAFIPFIYSVFSSQDTVEDFSPNTIIFGETGVGKSSIINLIAGQKLAHTSGDALGCTFQHRRYIVTLDGMSCALWDTTGLDEGTEGTVPARLAESNLRALMRGLVDSGGIHLVIYCIRGARLTKALKRNYDLFYVTVCRKKVPVALVVTGLEHQRGEMEAWWNENETVLRRHRMRFDAHACVTALDVQDTVIQERRSHSQKCLRELVARYSRRPAWKTDPSFISRVLPLFHDIVRSAFSTAKPKNTSRKVIVCDVTEDAPDELSPGIGCIGDGQYEFVRIDKRALQTPTPRTLEDLDALRTFYDIAGGQITPMIVVLRGCEDEEVARTCRGDVASRHNDIQAHFVSLPTGAVYGQSDAQAMLNEMVERLCIEHVEVKAPSLRSSGRYTSGKRLLTSMVDTVTSVAFSCLGDTGGMVNAETASATPPAPGPSA
jgi:hypothetical protein